MNPKANALFCSGLLVATISLALAPNNFNFAEHALLGANKPLAGSEERGLKAATQPVGKLFQVIVNVRDMGTQLAFYRDTLGFRVIYPEKSKDWNNETFIRLSTGGALLTLHAGRETENAKQEPRLSFLTADVFEARERLLKVGVKLGEIRTPAPGVRVVDGRDPEGNAFHLESHASDPTTRQGK